MHRTGRRGNRERWAEIVKSAGKCSYCPPHGGENCGRRPKCDRYKSRRKGQCSP